MKLFSIAAISAVALSSVEASRGRNKHMARSLDCSMNPEAPEQFIQCFYEKHASSVVDEKVTEYKRVASRITSALEKAGDNKKLQQKYTKAILIRNANLFGQEKQEMKDLFDNNVEIMDEYINLVKNNVNVEEARQFLNSLQHKTISEVENNFVKFLDKTIQEQMDKYASSLPDGIASINTNDAIAEVQNAVKSLPQVKQFLSENGDESLGALMQSLFEKAQDKAEELDIQGNIDELKSQLQQYERLEKELRAKIKKVRA